MNRITNHQKSGCNGLNGKHHGSSNGRNNGKLDNTVPQPPTNRIAGLLKDVFRPTENEEACLQRITEVWQAYLQRGLEARHLIGKLLNQQIGGPDDRQDRGKGVMALASERLKMSVSDLNRMRWTAHLFKSVKDMQGRHPEIDSWTKLKDKLPDLMPKSRKKKSATASPAARFVKKVTRSVQSLTSAIKQNRTSLKSSEQAELLERLQELAAVVAAKFEIRVTVTPPRTKLAS